MYTPEYDEVDARSIPRSQLWHEKDIRADADYAQQDAWLGDPRSFAPEGYMDDAKRDASPRQENPFLVAPGTPASVNWWPYPSWSGTEGFGPAAAPLASNIPTLQTLPGVIAPTVLLPSTTLAVSPIQTTSSPLTSDVASTNSASTLAPSGGLLSNTASMSMISISALPPQSSQALSQTYPLSAHRHFNVLYLIPVIAVVGLVLGALTSVLLFRWRRKRAAHSDHPPLQAGPRYEPPKAGYSPIFDDAVRIETRSTDPEKRYLKSVAPSRSPSVRPSRRPTTSTVRTSRSNTTVSKHFLSLPDHSARPESPSVYSVSTRPNSRATCTTGRETPFDEHYDGRRNKSLRRGLAEQLATDADDRPVKLSSVQAGSKSKDGTGTQDTRADASAHTPLLDDCEWLAGELSGPGFRIIEEEATSPEPDRNDISARFSHDERRTTDDNEPVSSWLAWTRSWSASSLGQRSDHTDHYTRASPRKTGSAKRRTTRGGTPSPVRTRQQSTTSSRPISRADLPASPPLISSSPLDAALSFGGAEERLVFPQPPAPAPLRVDKSRTAARTPRTSDSSPLPYPSSAEDSPYRGRLKKPSPSKRANRGIERGRSDAEEEMLRPSKRALSPAERHAIREGAVGRVNDIVAKSYAARGASTAGSEEDLSWMAGIEQRLEG